MVDNIDHLVNCVERTLGTPVDDTMKKILEYFNGQVLVSMGSTEFDKKISKDTGILEDEVYIRRMQLQRSRILGYEKGLSSVGGREMEYGLTESVRSRLKEAAQTV